LSLDSSFYAIYGGENTYSGSSQITATRSTLTVSDDNVVLSEQTNVYMHDGSVFNVQDGNVITSDDSVLSMEGGACFNLMQGSVDYSDQSSIRLSGSCWNVTGGSARFHDRINYELMEGSSLRISNGSFVVGDTSNIAIDNSEAFVSGGHFTVADQATMNVQNGASVHVTGGDAIFSDSISFSISDSQFAVDGGNVHFSDQSTLDWLRAELKVSQGDMFIKHFSTVSFDDSAVLLSGGDLRFQNETEVTFQESILRITQGSLHFTDSTDVSFEDSSVTVHNGHLLFADQSQVSFTRTPVVVSDQLGFVGSVETSFTDLNITVLNGDLYAHDNVQVSIQECNLRIGGGFYSEDMATLTLEDSTVTVYDGGFYVSDQGIFTMSRSKLDIIGGDFRAENEDLETRKTLNFTNSIINVRQTSDSADGGQMYISQQVDMTLRSSDATIDGDLILEGSAQLQLLDSSSFLVSTGVVRMEEASHIGVDDSSIFVNQGQLFAPGTIRAESGSEMDNSGVMQVEQDLLANCFDDMEEGAPLNNHGTMNFGTVNRASVLRACVRDLQHNGLIELGRTNLTLGRITTTTDSTITLDSSTISVTDSDNFSNEGTIGGSGTIQNSFQHGDSAVIMANGESGPTKLQIDKNLTSSGTIFFSINSRDLSDPDAITEINVGGEATLEGGRACICMNPSLVLQEGDRIDLLSSDVILSGKFDTVEFNCADCPRRNAKSIQSTQETCEPTSGYGQRSFAVLFQSCDGGSGGYLDSISPPWYVIFPVSIAVICFVFVFFGGALFLDNRIRKKKFQQKQRRKRSDRLKKMKQEATTASMSHSNSAHL